ncbi:DUF4192 domain-containing protein [Streptomyces sp. NPDC047017]|uniref:DUF4192 domain-containing protein n=1 Tax=Streptomyces sp. NPDC047017 TaxID=3155024 RepID=UPI0033FAB953
MTNHSEATGPFENGDIAYDGPGPEHQITLRTPAELADALPYLLGYRPEDSIVLVALHDQDGRGRFGGRARLGIPANGGDWPSAARQLAHGLITGGERRGAKPEQMVAFLCQEPAAGESGQDVMRRLQPLAHKLRTECGHLDVPVIEALCISGGRFWSYCCPTDVCCPDDGWPMGLPGTSVLAAAATYAGLQVRGTLRELHARLLPWENSAAREQEAALDAAGRALVPRILDESSRAAVAEDTLELAGRVLRRFAAAPLAPGAAPAADLRDDGLLDHQEAASLILGLQDRTTRDRAAEWMEGDEAGPALRLWRALARRCVGPYGEHAAAPLTLAGWVAWSTGDGLEAREALAMALGADPEYLFARLLHQACNEGLDPESVRRCLRTEREERARTRTPSRTAEPTAGDRGPGEKQDAGEAQADDGTAGTASGGARAAEDLEHPSDREDSGDTARADARRAGRPTKHDRTGTTLPPAVTDEADSRSSAEAEAETETPSRRRRRSRPDASGPARRAADGTRPPTARTGDARPGPSGPSARTRSRAAVKDGTRAAVKDGTRAAVKDGTHGRGASRSAAAAPRSEAGGEDT